MGKVIESNVLGRLGRVFQTLTRERKNDIKDNIYNKDFKESVPSVPAIETELKTCNVTTETEVPPTVEKTCKCGRPATNYVVGQGEIEEAQM